MLEVISKTGRCPHSGETNLAFLPHIPGAGLLLRVIPLLSVVLTFAYGCGREPLANGLASSFETNCSFCHGNEENAAPPLALDGSDNRSDIGVGAHQAHLQNGSIAMAVECAECHVVPEAVDDPGHRSEGPNDTRAEVTFGELAKTDDSNPTWNHDTARCSNTYCHGATLSGGKRVEPIWTEVDEGQIDCDACHGSPPPSPHIQQVEITDCADCHPDTVDEDGNIKISEGRHINGTIETPTECYACHGTEGVNDAPPPALNGSEDTNDIGVGAHQSHLQDGANREAIACEQCHIVPEAVDDPGHQPEGPNDTHAEVTFGDLASGDDLEPSWDRETNMCSNTYCHGASLSGGNHVEPIWTLVDDSQVDCDGCHGDPPPLPHPQGERTEICADCHPDTVNRNGEIKISEGKHIDGTIDSPTECYSCHGKEDGNEAPPFALDGSEDTSDIGVGAHQSHLQNGAIAQAVECDQCHIVPEAIDDPDHQPEGPDDMHAEVTFGSLASSDDLEPSWNRDTVRCTNTYCHGATLTGGNQTEPVWTQVDESQIDCDSCHGDPPPSPHPQGVRETDCSSCHPDTVDQDGNIKVSAGKHINGTVDRETECYSCHGKENVNDAPPFALDGSEDTGEVGVGAHQSHMQNNAIAEAVDCEQCHVVPEAIDDPGHLPEGPNDTHAEVTFGALASDDDLEPSWNRETARCTDTYCHGATLAGGNHTEPIWTQVDGSQIDCDGCHGNPPPSPHFQGAGASQCANCHPNTVDQSGDIRVSEGRHIDGKIDETTECYSCHGKEDTNAAPPYSLNGSEDTSQIGVGAHQAHMQDGTIARAFPCEQCHVVPQAVDDADHLAVNADDTHAEVVFGALASATGLSPSWNRVTALCTNTYCHGAGLTGGNRIEPIWTLVDGTQIECDSCHGYPPPSPHLQGTWASDCSACHANTVDANGQINISDGQHVDGTVDVIIDCDACHGTRNVNAAPPLALNGAEDTSYIGVGAHQAHVLDGPNASAIACESCHVVPTNIDDPNHFDQSSDGIAEVTFGGLANTDGLTPDWDRANAKCTNTYCHGTTLAGGNNHEPVWTQVDGSQSTCDSCHGFPPPDPHIQSTACSAGACHPRTVISGQTIDLLSGTHIDGEITIR